MANLSRSIVICALLMTLLLSACTKEQSTTLSDWQGAYTTDDGHDTFQSVILTANGSGNMLKVQIKAMDNGYVYNFTVIEHAVLSSTSYATFSEPVTITGHTGTYLLSGDITRTARGIILNGTATQDTNVITLKFSGLRQ